MPDFTVIDGGGQKRDWDRELGEQLFRDFAVALTRGLGGGNLFPTTGKFLAFLEHMQQTGLAVGPVIDAAMRELSEDAFRIDGGRQDYEMERDELRLAAWRSAVEHMTHDGLARARQSKRDSEMASAVDDYVVGSEARSRKNGWSYLHNLTKHLGKWPVRGKASNRKAAGLRDKDKIIDL
jgi:hypothetical protein